MRRVDVRPEASRRRVRLILRGRVQGVGFRWFAHREASRLGLAGWVANEPDGSVAVVAEGASAALDHLVAALREGPPGAWVRAVEVHEEAPAGLADPFHIRGGAHRGD